MIARFIQGLAAALLFPQVYAGIRLNFDETQARKAFGWLGMTLGLAAIAGQALGGWLITLNLFDMSWRLIFLVNLPLVFWLWYCPAIYRRGALWTDSPLTGRAYYYPPQELPHFCYRF